MTVNEIVWCLVRATGEYKTWWYCDWQGKTVEAKLVNALKNTEPLSGKCFWSS